MTLSQDVTIAASRVRIVITDVDGVLTDGGIGITASGEEFKVFSVLDGLGVRLLQQAGIEVSFLSSRPSTIVGHRAAALGVRLHENGVSEKRPALERMLENLGIGALDACYVGDDLVDLACMRVVGLPIAVPNACEEVKAAARYITRRGGGRGAFREVAELILNSQGAWESLVETYR
jgi:3-deoxy-D-manno-octulosonate 8-phosphate phosphatase (KDO 8-P phosphatase)